MAHETRASVAGVRDNSGLGVAGLLSQSSALESPGGHLCPGLIEELTVAELTSLHQSGLGVGSCGSGGAGLGDSSAHL